MHKTSVRRKYQDFLRVDAKVFGLTNISEELFELREDYCRNHPEHTVSSACKGCPVRGLGWHLGLSCNNTLDKFPGQCNDIFRNTATELQGV